MIIACNGSTLDMIGATMSDFYLFLTNRRHRNSVLAELSTEFVRKSIHLLVALVPALAAWNRPFTMFLLSAGTVFYAYS